MNDLYNKCVQRREDFIKKARLLKCKKWCDGKKNFEVYTAENIILVVEYCCLVPNEIKFDRWYNFTINNNIKYIVIDNWDKQRDNYVDKLVSIDDYISTDYLDHQVKNNFISCDEMPSEIYYFKNNIHCAIYYCDNNQISNKVFNQ